MKQRLIKEIVFITREELKIFPIYDLSSVLGERYFIMALGKPNSAMDKNTGKKPR